VERTKVTITNSTVPARLAVSNHEGSNDGTKGSCCSTCVCVRNSENDRAVDEGRLDDTE